MHAMIWIACELWYDEAMSRLIQRKVVLAAALTSLVGSTGLWITSTLCFARTADMMNGRSRFDVRLFEGGVQLEFYEQPMPWVAISRRVKWDAAWPRLWLDWNDAKIGVFGTRVVEVFVPLWIPVAACAGLTWLAWRRARLGARGSCPACGYNLAGLRERVCPECGRRVSSSAAVGADGG